MFRRRRRVEIDGSTHNISTDIPAATPPHPFVGSRRLHE